MSISNELFENFGSKSCRKVVNLKVPIDSREHELSIDGKEVKFPTKFARFVHKRKKMCKAVLDKKSNKIHQFRIFENPSILDHFIVKKLSLRLFGTPCILFNNTFFVM